ncbi:NUDIX hydrolase [Bradyrhizobium sp. WSM 1738]|uniref:NUDIX hydrolase n=1 Tax=Bradyrhizobium hereditatis TaxID=2821405 RepID=UPI001CE31369|nr:NUDIX hydrolase [Bradyrhizobium hereditatis]MCA6114523.1 NUDIX hydrolase [Bradyrhizobium hereditatis]
MARTPVLAAGGIVLRQAEPPLFAVVRLRKRNEWVLPKGKLDDGETPRAAAEREVMEETGHEVSVHEFLGTLAYESRGGSKVVHYWRMEARGDAAYELMRDVKAVDWLPLPDAVDRLSRDYERAFLENVGPIALSAAAHAATTRKPRAKQPAQEKRRSRRSVAPPSVAATPPADQPPPPIAPDDGLTVMVDTVVIHAAAGASVDKAQPTAPIEEAQPVAPPSFAPEIEPMVVDAAAMRPQPRRNLFQRMRDWLRRAA